MRAACARSPRTAQAGAARADGGRRASTRARVDERAIGFRLAPRINAAGRLYRADAGARAAADRGRRARAARSPTSSTPPTPSAAQSSSGSASRPRRRSPSSATAQRLRARRRGLAPGRDRDRRLAPGRAPPPPGVLIALDGEARHAARGAAIPGFDLLGGAARLRRRTSMRYGGHRAAAGLTIERDAVDGVPRGVRAPRRRGARRPRLLRRSSASTRSSSGAELGLELAEELERSRRSAWATPARAARARRALRRRRGRWGRAATLRFTVSSGGARARAVAFGCDGSCRSPTASRSTRRFRLERNEWNGAVEPRLVLRHAQRCAPRADRGARRARGLPERGARELEPLEPPLAGPIARRPRPAPPEAAHGARPPRREPARRARRRSSPPAEPVLALCADVAAAARRPRQRARRLRARCSYAALERDPALAARFTHLVALDPPRARPESARSSAQDPGSPTWPGARLSYALLSRYTSWSTVSALRSSPSTGASGSGGGWPARSSSACSAATVSTAARRDWPADW